jgi:hypothetical protein
MEGKYNEIELLFIREILDQHGEYLVDLLVENIESKGLIKEGNLLESLNYKVIMQGNNPVLQFSFYSYGRAIEIQYFKKSTNTRRWQQVNTNQLIWGMRKNQARKKKKDTTWYSKTVYGSINRLIGRLGSEFTENEIQRLKGIIEEQKKRGYSSSSNPTTYAV